MELKPVKFSPAEEPWCYVRVDGGKILPYRTIVIGVQEVVGQTDNHGDQAYQVQTALVFGRLQTAQ